MSWAEIFKINTNMKRPLNEQLRDMKFRPMRIITSTGTYTPEKTGKYMVICVGAGGNGSGKSTPTPRCACSGGGGGVAVKTLTLSKSTAYNVTVGTTASFTFNTSTIVTATSGSSSVDYSAGGAGGTASGGDFNYAGISGSRTTVDFEAPMGGSVGVAISELTRSPAPVFHTFDSDGYGATAITLQYGDSILNYGGGGTGAFYYNMSSDSGSRQTSGKTAAVIIIPLEMEE